MEAIMQIIVRREQNEEAFAERLNATMTVFRVSGATQIRFLQLGDGSVLVIAYREATAREVAEAEKGREGDGSSDNPFYAAVELPATAELLFDIVKRTRRIRGEEVERVALVTTVQTAKRWSPATVRLVLDEVEGFLFRLLRSGGFDRALGDTVRLVGVVEGLRMVGPAARG
jgi:hypothetical protein